MQPPMSASTPRPTWKLGQLTWDLQTPLVMGVLNLTPDSFSDGGEYLDLERSLARAMDLAAQGADILDIGGASSHPSAKPVSAREEMGRVLPLVRQLADNGPLPLSIDTQQPEVAEACLDLGAHLINDVGGLADDAMARLAGRYDVPLVIMFNNLAEPRDPSVPVVEAMRAFFQERIARAEAAGARRIILDPGYGFGKSLEDNLALLRGLGRLGDFRRPVMICTSRKGSLGRITGEKRANLRAGATIASSIFAVAQGAVLVRVHDVREFRQALTTWQSIGGTLLPE